MQIGLLQDDVFWEMLRAKLVEWGFTGKGVGADAIRVDPFGNIIGADLPSLAGDVVPVDNPDNPMMPDGTRRFVTAATLLTWMPKEREKYCSLSISELNALYAKEPDRRFPAPRYLLDGIV